MSCKGRRGDKIACRVCTLPQSYSVQHAALFENPSQRNRNSADILLSACVVCHNMKSVNFTPDKGRVIKSTEEMVVEAVERGFVYLQGEEFAANISQDFQALFCCSEVWNSAETGFAESKLDESEKQRLMSADVCTYIIWMFKSLIMSLSLMICCVVL